MRVLVTGASGFIGAALCRELARRGDAVVVLGRSAARTRAAVPEASAAHAWDPMAGPAPAEAFEGVEAVIHLAGESVAGRWTAAKRRAIHDSREAGTRHLVEALAALASRPRALISSSAVGYYGDRGDEELDESSTPGDDFLARVCIAWEEQARRAEDLGLVVARLRTGIVLDAGGGALGQMLTPARLGLGGPLGSGRQWWPWISRADAVSAFVHVLDHALDGAVNLTAPHPVRQADFARALGRALSRPAVLPAPAFALRLALGGFSAELLSSKRVVPRRLEDAGFEWRHPRLDDALGAILAA